MLRQKKLIISKQNCSTTVMTASNVLAASDKGVRRAMTGCLMKLRLRNISHDITRPERVASHRIEQFFPPSPNTFVEIEKSSWIIELKANMHELHKFVYYSCCCLSGQHSMLTALRWRFFVSIRSSNFPSLHRKLHRNHPILSMLLNDLHRRLHSSCLLDRRAYHSDAWTLE